MSVDDARTAGERQQIEPPSAPSAAASRQTAPDLSLGDQAQHNRRSPMPLRWVHLQLIAEPARHADRADIPREQLLTEARP